MTNPKCYDPMMGCKYQIVWRDTQHSREWEHCDYAENRQELKHLLKNYREAYGPGSEFKSILLPRKFWSAVV